MIEFDYIAKNKDGELQKGVVEADSVSAAAKLLSAKNLFPIKISREESKSFNLFNKVSIKDKAFLMRQLSTMINAGLPISQALKTLSGQISNKVLIETVEQITRDVEGGSPLSSSFSKFPNIFNSTEITLLASGEASGTLDKVLVRMANSLEGDYRIRQKIKSAMAYPIFILVVVFVVLFVMAFFIMPKMEELYSSFNAKLPTLTLAIISIVNNLHIFFTAFLGLAFGAFVGFKSYVKTATGRYNWDYVKINLPLFGKFLQNLYLSRFSRTLSVLIGSGVSIVDSLNIVSKAIGNTVYEKIIFEATKKVKSGVPLSTPLRESKEFPPIVSQMVSIGEQTGELDNMLTNLSDYYDEEVDNYIKSLASIIEPLLVVVMGLIVGIILVSIMLPLYSIGKVIA